MNSNNKICNNCGKEVVSNNAIFCKYCGNKLNLEQKVTKSLLTKSDNVEDVKKNIVKKYAIICLISAIAFLITSVSFESIIQGEGETEKQLSLFLIMSAPLMYIFSSISGIALVKNKGSLSFLAIVFGIVSCIIMAILGGDPAGFFIEIVFFVTLYCMMFPCWFIEEGYSSNIIKKLLNGCFIYSIVITTIFSVISIIFPIPVLVILPLIIIVTIFSSSKARQGIILKRNQLNKVTIPLIKKNIIEIINEFEDNIIKKIYLFGSYSRGEETSDSDIDLRIVPNAGFNLMHLGYISEELKDRLGKTIDVITSDLLDPVFFQEIKKDEICIYEQ